MSQDNETLKIEKKITHGIAILTPAGKMMEGKKLDTNIKKLIDAGITKVIIDLGKVSWVSSLGLGGIIASRISLNEHHGELKLIRVNQKIESIIMITQVNELFETHDTLESALPAFKTKSNLN